MYLLRAWTTLFWMSFRRSLWSMTTLIVALPVAIVILNVPAFRRWQVRQKMEDAARDFEVFSDWFVLVLFASFLVPICALAYGTTTIGGDREDRTLLFLLIRPVPRAMILLAKILAALPLAVGVVIGSYFVCCRLAGPVGERAFDLYLPAMLAMTVAYVCVFHCFAVMFRHSTIIALAYALFMEVFLGNMPGIVKRVAVNYYGRSMVYQLGAPEGLTPLSPTFFEPLSAQAGAWALAGIALAGLLLAVVVFQQREYRDLT